MIRDATHDDIPALVGMGCKFHAMSPHKFLGEYDAEAVSRMLAFMIDSPSAVVIRHDNGAIGGVMAPIYFAPGTWMIEESFWWADRDGMSLLSALEDRGRDLGASVVMMCSLDNEHSAAIGRVLSRKGYVPVERRYVKELTR